MLKNFVFLYLFMSFDGKNSDWNEAALKFLRIHQIQNAINFYKGTPLVFSDGEFHYKKYFVHVDILRGEGYSMYSSEERKKADEFYDVCESLLENSPPHKPTITIGINGKNNSFILIKENYDKFMKAVRKYEDLIRDLNNEHGLSTKNQQKGRLL